MRLQRFFNIRKRIRSLFYLHYNKLYFRLCGITLGNHVKIGSKVYINKHPTGKITIGSNTTIFSGDNQIPLIRNITANLTCGANAILSIGEQCGLSNPVIWATKSINIGNHVLIGANCQIMDSDSHSIDYEERMNAKTSEGAKSAPITIGDNAWVGCNCLIFKGVNIGKRSVIGGGSVVTHSIPDDCIAAGNPCEVIRYIKN